MNDHTWKVLSNETLALRELREVTVQKWLIQKIGTPLAACFYFPVKTQLTNRCSDKDLRRLISENTMSQVHSTFKK